MKQISRILLLLATVGLLAGCGGRGTTSSESGTSSNSENPTTSSSSESGSSDTSDEQPPSSETNYTVFFYQKFIGEEKIQSLQTELNALLGSSFDHINFEVLTEDALVKAAGEAVVSYNTQHNIKIDALLGFNGDSENTLANAGYQKASEQNYTYGTDTSRKLWVLKESVNPTADTLIQEYLFAHYGPTKVNLSKATEQLKPGESVEVTAALDISIVGVTPEFTAVSDKSYATVSLEGNKITVALSESAVVGEVATITVSYLTYTPGTLAITVISKDTVKEKHLVVAFYNKYITDDKKTEIETNFASYLTTNSIELDSVTFVGLGDSGTKVGPFATLVRNYNQDTSHAHPINVLIGCNGDSENALSNAGYKKLSNNSYTYGTDTSRKIWVVKSYDEANPDVDIKTFIDFMNANYLPAEE